MRSPKRQPDVTIQGVSSDSVWIDCIHIWFKELKIEFLHYYKSDNMWTTGSTYRIGRHKEKPEWMWSDTKSLKYRVDGNFFPQAEERIEEEYQKWLANKIIDKMFTSRGGS